MHDPRQESYEKAGTVAPSTARRHRFMAPTEPQIRALRWLYMRGDLTAGDLPTLNWINIGGLVCRGLLHVPGHPEQKIELTQRGLDFIHSKVKIMRRRTA